MLRFIKYYASFEKVLFHGKIITFLNQHRREKNYLLKGGLKRMTEIPTAKIRQDAKYIADTARNVSIDIEKVQEVAKLVGYHENRFTVKILLFTVKIK